MGLGTIQLIRFSAALGFGEPLLPYSASRIATRVCGLPIVISTRDRSPQGLGELAMLAERPELCAILILFQRSFWHH